MIINKKAKYMLYFCLIPFYFSLLVIEIVTLLSQWSEPRDSSTLRTQ